MSWNSMCRPGWLQTQLHCLCLPPAEIKDTCLHAQLTFIKKKILLRDSLSLTCCTHLWVDRLWTSPFPPTPVRSSLWTAEHRRQTGCDSGPRSFLSPCPLHYPPWTEHSEPRPTGSGRLGVIQSSLTGRMASPRLQATSQAASGMAAGKTTLHDCPVQSHQAQARTHGTEQGGMGRTASVPGSQ